MSRNTRLKLPAAFFSFLFSFLPCLFFSEHLSAQPAHDTEVHVGTVTADNSRLEELFNHPSTLTFSNEELLAENQTNAIYNIRDGAQIADNRNVFYDTSFVQLYYTPGESYGYYLVEHDPEIESGINLSMVLFTGWKAFSDAPEQKHHYINIELALQHNLPYARWLYGFMRYDNEFSPESGKQQGLALLTTAAEEGDREAIAFLGDLYSAGKVTLAPDYEKAKHWFDAGIATNDAYSYMGEGNLYEHGLGVEQDHEKALEYYTIAAEHGLGLASYRVGRALYEGVIREKDYASAIFWLELAAEQNSPEAMHLLGVLYGYTPDYPDDELLSAAWLFEAARLEHPAAQYLLALAYQEGKGVEQDFDLFMLWLSESAANGYSLAQDWLADVYFYGELAEQNYTWAHELYVLAAIQGNANSMHQLGWMYQYGLAVPADKNIARAWYEQAIETGDFGISYNNLSSLIFTDDPRQSLLYRIEAAKRGEESAVTYLIDQYSTGAWLDIDPDQTLHWLQVGVERGHQPSILQMGLLYQNGHLVEKDPVIAVSYFNQTVQEETGLGYYNMAVAYITGSGVERNAAQSFEYFLRAAELDVEAGFFQASSVLMQTPELAYDPVNIERMSDVLVHGIERGNQMAIIVATQLSAVGLIDMWPLEELRRDAEAGNSLSQYMMADLLYKGSGLKKNLEEAYRFALRAANKGEPTAQFLVATMLSHGEGVQQNNVDAYMWMEIARQNGHTFVQLPMQELRRELSTEEAATAMSKAAQWSREL